MNENDRVLLEESEAAMNEHHHHLPPVKREWTIGTVLASVTSMASLLVFVGGAIWGYSRVTEATAVVPQLRTDITSNKMDIAVLKVQEQNEDQHYQEILSQLTIVNRKLDRLQENKLDKDTAEELSRFRR